MNRDDWKNPIFAQLVISLNLVLAGLRLGLKNFQVGEKWVYDNYSYLCKGLNLFALMRQILPLEFANKRAKHVRNRFYAIVAKVVQQTL